MWILGFALLVITTIAGLFIEFVLKSRNSPLEIDSKEKTLGMIILNPIVVILGLWIGYTLAFGATISYNEWYNGWEKDATAHPITCTRDGPCHYEYDCDPYEVTVTKYRTNSKGESEPYQDTETRYHDCPYYTVEIPYVVYDTLGKSYVIGHCFEANPVKWRATGGNGPSRVCRGVPRLWQEAYDRIFVHKDPGPTTARFKYDNLILASQNTVLKTFSDMIGFYKNANLIVRSAFRPHDHYKANKVQLFGCPESVTSQPWQEALMRLNASSGYPLQADIHVVVSCDTRINQDPDNYLIAAKADWQNNPDYGDDVLSKNGIVVLVGSSDGQTVDYCRAETGMPGGNGVMIETMKSKCLQDIPLTPHAVIGWTHKDDYFADGKDDSGRKIWKYRGSAQSGFEPGAIEATVWGLENVNSKFKRQSMRGGDPDDWGSGFTYTLSEIDISTGYKVTISIVTFILSCLMWLGLAAYGPARWRSRRGYRRISY